jgi:hypothetical protein
MTVYGSSLPNNPVHPLKEITFSRPQDNPSFRIELAAISALVFAVSLILWWRFLPLPHQDLGFYTEPALLLAKFGKLAGPGSQYIDLTYQKGIYNYPPGYYLILAGWIKLFGFSADSLLAYTHAVHAGILIILWALLRFRYACSRLTSSLVLLSIFPRIAHGRPDLTACFVSLLTWLALPEDETPWRIILSGCIAGAVLLVSPGYGSSIIVTLAMLILVRSSVSLRVRFLILAKWLFSAASVFAAVLAIVLYFQDSWTLAYVQFKTNAMIRGAQLNVWPNFHLFFTFVFSTIPFLLLAVVPALLVALATWRKPAGHLRNVTLAFLGGTAIWLAMNKVQFLTEYHYLFPAKSIFLGVLCSRLRFPSWVRALPLLIISLIGFYFYKADFLYLTASLRAEESACASRVRPDSEVAVDSLYFTRFYLPGHALNYETVDLGFWPRYLAAIPANLRSELLSGLQARPAEPSMLLVSAYTLPRYGELFHRSLPCVQTLEASERLRILGHTWNLPAHPYALIVCTMSAP